MENGAIFPLFYLPPVELFKEIVSFKDKNILIEKYEHFPKQSYRNRTSVYGPNGKLNLTVPITKGSKNHTAYKDVKISYNDNWQRMHWLSLQTSYRSSAYFEFYEDDFAPFYEKKYDFLFDYNLELFTLLLKQLKLSVEFDFTRTYEFSYPDIADFRESIHPKKESNFEAKKYFQVFEDKYQFMPNLSVVDLIFNQGPQASKYL